jgi:MFS family permease
MAGLAGDVLVFYDGAVNGYISKMKQFSRNAKKYLAFNFFLSMNMGIYGVIFNLYILKLGYHEDLLGLMLSITYIATGLAALPAALLCDRVGRKNTLIISSVITAMALLILYTITSKEVLLAASVLQGIGSALMTVSASPFLVENSTSDERMHLFSINAVMSTVAMIFGNLAGGIAPGLMASVGIDATGPLTYRYTLFLSLIAVLITFLPLLYLKEEKRKSATSLERLNVIGSTVKSLSVQKLIVINALVGIGAGMIVPFFNVYFHHVLSASTDQIGIIFSVAEVIMMAGLVILPLMAERLGKIKSIAFTQLASIPFLIMLAFTGNIFVAAFAYTMRMTLMNMANPAISSFNMEIVDERQRATVSSLTSMSWYLFQALSTYVSGILMANGNYVLPFMITCVVYVTSASLYYIFFMKVEKEMDAKPAAADTSIAH